ncbi:hypothetical protein [Candidatus Fukatsuia endosymbiont of Tuberolachnus salignus]|uniref:hypothetical protein n=1 Tax=Candidatus Fukatsuia endosymbiont of Tuberolachnus salignus TaxID=3077957 RepID=UPI00313E16AE
MASTMLPGYAPLPYELPSTPNSNRATSPSGLTPGAGNSGKLTAGINDFTNEFLQSIEDCGLLLAAAAEAYGLMEQQNKLGAEQLAAMQSRSKIVDEAQEEANNINVDINTLSGGKDPTKDTLVLPDDIRQALRDLHLTVNNQSIDDYIKGLKTDGKLNKGQLEAIKASLDNMVTRNNSQVTSDNLQIQKITQVYQMLVGFINKQQSDNNDLLKTIWR